MKFRVLMILLATTCLMAQKEDRREQTIGDTSPVALVGNSGATRAVNFAEDFEALSIGDINGQSGWFGQFGNWEVDNSNPFNGSQHLFSVSDGLGQTFAVSATITPGSTGTHVASAYLSMNNNSGVSWQFIPQAASQMFVVTRVSFNGDGTVSALVNDGMGNSSFVDTGATAPSGYFLCQVVVDEVSGMYSIYFDGSEIFTGLGFGTVIDNVAFLSGMEVQGPTFFADDVTISDDFNNVSIPTLGQWGMLVFLAGLGLVGIVVIRRTPKTA